MKLTPLRNNVIVEKLEKDMTTSSGIILSRSDEADKAKVVAIGSEVVDVEIGNTVLINWNKATKLVDGSYQVSVNEIVGVFD
ncbi:MAG: co-chaperone GroES [Proteobacteria bacterium]|nr:co-chaperone GroES [Pseudomonadota bacterium]